MEKISYLEAHNNAALEMPGASDEAIHEHALKLLQFHGEKFAAAHILDSPLVPSPDDLLA